MDLTSTESDGSRTAVIVGAGLGGLSSAVRLAARGWRVRVFEQQAKPGGKAGSEQCAGYRFDTGPSLLTMPYVFDELFREAGANRADHLEFRKLDTICNYFWPDGTTLNAPGDIERLPDAIEASTGEPSDHVRKYLKHAGRIHDVAAELFLRHSLHDPATYASRLFFRNLLRIRRIDPLRSLDRCIRAYFDDPRVVQLFNRYATYNGSSPFTTPATMGIIPFVEYAHGGYAVAGGVHSIPRALLDLARSVGVEFQFSRKVARINWETRGRRRPVTGVTLESGERAEARIVVSNVDVSVTYPDLLDDPDAHQLRRYRNLEPSSSGLVFFWGMNRSFSQLEVNNIFFSSDYPAEFREIFEDRRCPADPTVYVNITSKVTPSDAVQGGENWFVLVNAPYTSGQNWEAETARVRSAIIRRLGGALGCDLEACIDVENVMTPEDIEIRTGSYRGALYGISSNSRMAAFARHPNRSTEYPGLYFCGGSAHPGGGMPLVVLSGKIVADLVTRDEQKRNRERRRR